MGERREQEEEEEEERRRAVEGLHIGETTMESPRAGVSGTRATRYRHRTRHVTIGWPSSKELVAGRTQTVVFQTTPPPMSR